MNNKRLVIVAMLISVFYGNSCWADQRLTIGARLLGAGWHGDNGSVANDFRSSEGAQFAFTASYMQDKFYAGISLQDGDYSFNSDGPDQFTTAGRVSTANVDIDHQELDLLAGYYFWPRVSFFVDLKGVSNTWSNNGHEQNFGSLGVGASTFLPLQNNWVFFASLGFVGWSDIKDAEQNIVGEGRSTALELGGVYKVTQAGSINTGLKFRNYFFEYLDGSRQDYSINALFVGYTHSFNL